jgi:hypothetical protein
MNYAIAQPGALLFFGVQRKVTKETRPAITDSPLALSDFRGVGKNSLTDGLAGGYRQNDLLGV